MSIIVLMPPLIYTVVFWKGSTLKPSLFSKNYTLHCVAQMHRHTPVFLPHPPLLTDNPNPIVQTLKREVAVSQKLYKLVKRDLDSVVRVCQGEDKPTNNVREVMGLLSKDTLPPQWKQYVVPGNMTAGQWFTDFGLRCKHLSGLAGRAPNQYMSGEINLGLLLFPGAFITATRQAVARMLKFPLEKLRMSLDITRESSGEENTADGGSFLISGMGLQSCHINGGRLELLEGKLSSTMGVHRLWWKKDTSHALPKNSMELPLYLNPSRAELLAKLDLPVSPDVPSHEWYQVCAFILGFLF